MAAFMHPAPAAATSLALRFEGVISGVSYDRYGNLAPYVLDSWLTSGRSFTGTLSYTMDPVIGYGTAATKSYYDWSGLVGSLTVDFGAGRVITQTINYVNPNDNNGGSDMFMINSRVSAENVVVSSPLSDPYNSFSSSGYLYLIDRDQTVFANTDLPSTLPLLAAFEQTGFGITFFADRLREFSCNSPEGVCYDRGSASASIDLSLTSLQPVPLPPAAALMGAALGLLHLVQRKRRQSPAVT
jgi:hypothetical protein